MEKCLCRGETPCRRGIGERASILNDLVASTNPLLLLLPFRLCTEASSFTPPPSRSSSTFPLVFLCPRPIYVLFRPPSPTFFERRESCDSPGRFASNRSWTVSSRSICVILSRNDASFHSLFVCSDKSLLRYRPFRFLLSAERDESINLLHTIL